MWRLLIGLALLGLAFRPLPATAQEGCPAEASTPEDTASVLFAEYLANGHWDLAYEVLHPEAQLRVLRQAFAAARQARAVTGPLLDVEVFPARVSPGWVWGITGVRFTGVAEVPVRFVRGVVLGTVPTVEIVPLVRVGDCWRWLPPVLP
jgi:hypothetical protein